MYNFSQMYYTYSDGWNNVVIYVDNVDLVSDSSGQNRHTIPVHPPYI